MHQVIITMLKKRHPDLDAVRFDENGVVMVILNKDGVAEWRLSEFDEGSHTWLLLAALENLELATVLLQDAVLTMEESDDAH